MALVNLGAPSLPANAASPEIIVNTNDNLLDYAMNSHIAINFSSDADLTLSTSGSYPQQWQYGVIELTDTGGALTDPRNVIVPVNERVYKFVNNTAQQLTMKTSAGTGVDVAASQSTIAFCDGTNVRELSAGGGGAGTTYTLSAETATGGANVRLTGSDASTDDVKLAAGSNVTITRTDADTITIASTGSGAATSSQLETYTYTATASQTAFSGADDNGNSLVFESFNNILVLLNGVKLVYTDDYTVGSNSITLVSGANAGDVLEVVVVEVAPQGENYLINGNFVIQQWPSANATTNDSYFVDRWKHGFGDGAGTVSQESFTLGQTDVPGEPEHFYRHARTSASTVSSIVTQQRVEGVRSLAGQTATVSFYAKAGASKTFNVDFLQSFGTGGTPSADVITNAGDIAATTSWQKFTFTVSIPSISGKTVGTDGNDYLAFRIEEAASFGTFTLDIAQAQLEEGSIATDYSYRGEGEELSLCQRYFWLGNAGAQFNQFTTTTGQAASWPIKFPVTMRTIPTLSIADATSPVYTVALNNATEDQARLLGSNSSGASATAAITIASTGYTAADAEL